MAEKKEYRNAVRSRRMIRQAFMDLLHEKPLEKITATDIINRADINRSTFYAHYPDVRGIIEEILREVVTYTRSLWEGTDFSTFFDDPTPILHNAAHLLIDNRELYTLLRQSSTALQMLEEMKKILVEMMLAAPEVPEEIRSSPVYAIRVRFFFGGIIDIYCQWMTGELECSLDQLSGELASLIQESSRGHLPGSQTAQKETDSF